MFDVFNKGELISLKNQLDNVLKINKGLVDRVAEGKAGLDQFEAANIHLAEHWKTAQATIAVQKAEILAFKESNERLERACKDKDAKVKCVQKEVTGLLLQNKNLEEDNAELNALLEDEANNFKGQISTLGHALSDRAAQATEIRDWLDSCPWERL